MLVGTMRVEIDGVERGDGRVRRPSWGGLGTQNVQWVSPSFIIWISKYNNASDLKASSTHKPLITCKE